MLYIGRAYWLFECYVIPQLNQHKYQISDRNGLHPKYLFQTHPLQKNVVIALEKKGSFEKASQPESMGRESLAYFRWFFCLALFAHRHFIGKFELRPEIKGEFAQNIFHNELLLSIK